MNITGNITLGFHGLLGVAWIISLALLSLNLAAFKKNYSDDHRKGALKLATVVRATGGITIIIGLVILLLPSIFGISLSFNSLSGAILAAGILSALVAYVVIGEGFLMRNLKGMNSENSRKLLNAAVAELALAVVALLLMVVATSL